MTEPLPAHPTSYEWKFPIDADIELILRGPADLPAIQGGHTLAISAEVLAGALATVWHKNKHYAGAWREQGWMGNLARVMSKAARLRNMLWRDTPGVVVQALDEPVQDTIQDMINLLVFLTLNLNGGNKWGRGSGDR